MHAHVSRLPVSYYDANHTGALVTRVMNDVEGVRTIFGTGLIEFVGGLLTSVIALAVLFGARKMVYVKDEDGLYTADPKKDTKAELIPRISLAELLSLDLNDLIVERAVLDLMKNTQHIREIQFVNGLRPGQLTAALDGEPVGTVIYRQD